MDFGAILKRAEDSVILFDAGSAPKKISGTAQLLQSLVIELMSDPQPSIGRGSGFVSTLRSSSPDDRHALTANLSRALNTAKTHLLTYQADDPSLLDSERLLNVTMIRLSNDGLRWIVDLELEAVSGRRVSIPVA